MKNFLKRHKDQSDVDNSSSNEELYERLFPKIGRDFIYREDFEEVISQILELINRSQIGGVNTVINFKSNAKAVLKASEYKAVIESGKDGSKIYKDLIKIDELEDGSLEDEEV